MPDNERNNQNTRRPQDRPQGNQRAGNNHGNNGNRGNNANHGNNGNRGNRGTAQRAQGDNRYCTEGTAPYNFVSLPQKIISSPLEKCVKPVLGDVKKVQSAFRTYIEKNTAENKICSGVIELDITSETPCFVGGNIKNEEAFFAPDGTPIIPGSSLRGMVKNLFKIITCGSMRPGEDFHDQRLYYRSMAAVQNIPGFGESYRNHLGIRQRWIDGNRYSITGARAGFLVHQATGDRYFICPARAVAPRPEGVDSNKEPRIVWRNNGCVFYTGPMPGRTAKEHHDEFQVMNWTTKYEIEKDVIDAYNEDRRRGGANGNDEKAKAWSLFEMRGRKTGQDAKTFTNNQFDMVVPCYFTLQPDTQKVGDFGFGPFYRIPYDKRIKDHIPKAMQDETRVDYSDAVFGRKEYWGGRVFFEDARWGGDLKDLSAASLAPAYSHPLMSPNPTSFQLYLKTKADKAQHWGLDTQIRGYKLYWHQACGERDWQLVEPTEKIVNGTTKITPLKAGSTFHGRIRFRDLTSVELGALLAVFDLAKQDPDLRYKLGRGKSIGMGSVKIETKCFIDDLQGDILGADGWTDGTRSMDDKEYQSFLSDFRAEMQARCKEQNMEGAYQILQGELRHMLDWKNQTRIEHWADKVRGMKISDRDKPFQKRVVLHTVGVICNDEELYN